MCDDAGALRAEVAELRAEVERLRAWQAGHVCAAPVANQCTCSIANTRCPLHLPPGWTGYVAPLNVCGGAVGVPQTVIWNPGDPSVTMWQPTAGAAGCAPTMVYAVLPS